MKKILVSLFLVLCLTGCISKESIKQESKEGIVIQHFVRTDNSKHDNYNIEVYSDRRIIYSYLVFDAFKEINLSEEQYEELINYAFSSKILNLDSDISSNESADDLSSHIVLYFDDGSNFKTGGINPINDNYKEFVTMLNNYFK